MEGDCLYLVSTQIVRVMDFQGGCFCTIPAAAIVSALTKIGASLSEACEMKFGLLPAYKERFRGATSNLT